MTDKEIFLDICKNEIHRDGIDKLLDWLVKSDFFTAPASTKYHGNFEGGLCAHSLNVYRTLKDLCEKYFPEASQETIAIVGLFHDFCKINFYKMGSRNVKDEASGQWIKKDVWEIDEKIPLGHGEKSCIILQWYIKLSVEELLAIRWHMGGFDTAVKGGDHGLNGAQYYSKLVVLLHAADILASNLMEDTVK